MKQEKKAEPVRVLDLMCGAGPAGYGIAKRYKGRAVEYHGIDGELRLLPKRRNFRQFFHKQYLSFGDAQSLKEQLGKLVGGKQFDEVHLHMPTNSSAASAGSLRVLAGFLKPGGKLFHSFDVVFSPVMSRQLRTAWYDPESSKDESEPLPVNEVLRENKARIAKNASTAGLVLEKYGYRSTWKPIDAALIYSHYGDKAQHFMILRKPRARANK